MTLSCGEYAKAAAEAAVQLRTGSDQGKEGDGRVRKHFGISSRNASRVYIEDCNAHWRH